MNTISPIFLFLTAFIPIWGMSFSDAEIVEHNIFQHPAKETFFLESDFLSLEFDAENGALIGLQDLNSGDLIADSENLERNLWRLYFQDGEQKSELVSSEAGQFIYAIREAGNLEMEWTAFPNYPRLVVTVKVEMDDDESLSAWSIEWESPKDKIISKADFPLVSGIYQNNRSALVVPEWMGSIIKDPASVLSGRKLGRQRFSWVYPGILSMQFIGLHTEGRTSFYAACDDPFVYLKDFGISLNEKGSLDYLVSHYPNVDSSKSKYAPNYQVKIGTIEGDWVDMAERYRSWAIQQSWSINSRFKNGLVPSWAEETALWVWNRGRSDQVMLPAMKLKERSELPISVLWHWWHGASYDDEFPEYLPPREGNASFKKNVALARDKGIRPLVYMNELQWGSTTESWEQENAHIYAVKDEEGQLRSHVYNIFSKRPLTNMCITTPFWRNKYSGLAKEAVNELGVGGIYMDQACISVRCYDREHGHPLGGGNYWAMYSGFLTNQIRSGIPMDREVLLSGEGVCEAWLPYLDVFLALQVSRERYGGVGNWETIPLFHAVYHEYAITYGNYSSLLRPPYDELWPDEHRPPLALTLLPEKFNTQFLMEQARSFVWGMQPMISNYRQDLDVNRSREINYLILMGKVRNESLKYLLHGRFVRPPQIEVDSAVIDISKLSIYAGQKENVTEFKEKYPMIYYGAWKAGDGNLGIPVANISDKSQSVVMRFSTADYDLGTSGEIYLRSVTDYKRLKSYSAGEADIYFEAESRGVYMLELIPD